MAIIYLKAVIILYLQLVVETAASTTAKAPTQSTKPATTHDCTLSADPDVPLFIQSLLSKPTSLIKYTINTATSTTKINDTTLSTVYQPLFWVRTTGRQGRGLLLLTPNYDYLSLQTLEVSVETTSVDVMQYPPGCLQQLKEHDTEALLRKLVINDFQNTSSDKEIEFDPDDNVCNLHLVDDSGTAQFKYYCCNRKKNNELNCHYLQSDLWLDIFFTALILIKILIILFSPLLVPEVYYRVKHVAASYIFKCMSGRKMILNTTLTVTPGNYPDEAVKVKLSALRDMENFKKCILSMGMDETRPIALDQINMKVKYGRLLPEDYAPVGIFRTLYDSFFKCKIRRSPAVKDCCDTNFMVKSPCGRSCSWYRVLKSGMRFIMLWLLAVPWLVRVGVYYRFEHDEITMRKNAAKSRGLSFSMPENLTLLLTPIHELFLCIYGLLVFEIIVFGVLGFKVQERLKAILRQCFRDMKEVSKVEMFGWIVRVLVRPCKLCGGLGIFIGILYWIFAIPVLLLVLAFYIYPTVNITFRLLGYFVIHLFPRNCFTRTGYFACVYRLTDSIQSAMEMENIKKQNSLGTISLNTCWGRIQQLVIIILCLISMFSVIILINEFASFIVEVIVYTMMGIILNAGTLLIYVSLLFILGMYGNQTFGNVTSKFMSFNKKMHEIVLGHCKEKVEKGVFSEKKNLAFMVKTPHSSEIQHPVELTTDTEGNLQWRMKRFCLFLSKTDEPLIPTRFYFKACRMPYYAAPGELLINYLNAALEFSVILLFLVFVFIVVLAFGDTYDISATNRWLATIVGGFIPFMLKKILKSHSTPSIDESNIHFQTVLNELLDTYEEVWPTYDIDIKDDYSTVKPVSDNTSDDRPTSEDNVKITVEPELDETLENADECPDATVDLVIDARNIDSENFADLLKPKWYTKSTTKNTESQRTNSAYDNIELE